MPRSVAQKLQLKPGMRLWVSHSERLPLLGELPTDVQVQDVPEGSQAMVLFVDDAQSASELLEIHRKQLPHVPLLWFAYPKGGRADINRDSLWPMVAEHGLRPVSQVAIDEVWSALRFRPLREGERQFQES